MPSRELTSRKIQAIRSRQKIFDTAVDLFDSKGYESVTIEEICRKAGFSTGAFYNYFKSKDQIFMEQFMDIDDYYEKVIDEIPADEDTIEKLRLFLGAAMRYISDMGSRFLRIVYYTQLGPDKRKSYIASEKRYLYKVTYSLIEEGQAKDEIRKDMNSQEIALRIINCHRGIIYDWCLKRGAFDLEEEGKQLLEILLDGIRA